MEARYRLANCLKDLGRLPEAESEYRRVLELTPAHAQALNNLGTVLELQGRADQAADAYRRALAQDARLAQPYSNLGRLLQSQGRAAEAARVFENAVAAGLDAGYFGHLAGAARGTGDPRAPESYVRGTFDAFAAHFDEQLRELGYRVPRDLARLAGGRGRVDAALDLGCGTGLVGEALRGRCSSLVGVDLSPAMLDQARKRGRYTALHAAEIGAWLRGCAAASFDLAFAADVFIYIGELDDAFAGVARCLKPGGAFLFSVETCEGEGWRLLPSGRYAQSAAYVRRVAADAGFVLDHSEPTVIRTGFPGELYLLSTRAS